jgi:hypothetical protein
MNLLIRIRKGHLANSKNSKHEHPASSVVSMLAKINALPGSKIQLSIRDWNCKRVSHQGSFNMSRHVIGSFRIVFVMGCIFRYHFVEMTFEVNPHSRVGIFVNRQARGV